jgi:hypothetical protein
MRPVNFPWAIVLARYADKPSVPQPPDYYQDFYTRGGTGGVVDYWREVTFGNLDLTGSQVFGWLTMTHSSTELTGMTFPAARSTLVQWGRDAAAAAGIDLTPFRNVLVVHNDGVDHGAAGNGVLIVQSDTRLCEFGFICHEMGHGHGLPHSWSANGDVEYGDGWDIMSFATTTPLFPVSFRGASGMASVGLNARNVQALGVLEPSRLWSPAGPDFSATITLDPLNQAQIGNHGSLVASIPPGATAPARPDGSTWTVEFRRKSGWDQAIPEDAVVIHQVRTNTLSYLQPAMWSSFTAGQQFVTPAPEVYVKVAAIGGNPSTATLRIWDLPEGCLRKEDSKPKVYLIHNGTKRWVTSPAVLFALGKGWGDVRVVPDGALGAVPDGPDVVQMVASVSPRPVPLNRPVSLTVSTTDAGSGTPVAGRVLVDGVDRGATNSALSLTLRSVRTVIPGTFPREFEIQYPTVTARASGYADVDVDCGFPDV